ncbi:MAG TPA: YbhB/YbcL family Raf kinase inhibitor-like protein [Chthoniobacterales bacterium]
MKDYLHRTVWFTALFSAILVLLNAGFDKASAQEGKNMKITTSAFQEGGNIPSKFTCDGADVSPPLRIEGAPASAKSLVLIMDDPDAPGGVFTHWLAWNIDPHTNEIPEGGARIMPARGTNDFGKLGYGGPCPPSGTHRYFFKIFALDFNLDLKSGAKRHELEKQIHGHIIARGQLMGGYARSH